MAGVGDGAPHASVEATTDDAGARVVRIGGELDISTVADVEGRLESIVDEHGRGITFDLSTLEFMDSSGIAMLLRTAERVGPVVIRNPSYAVRRVIDATGLAQILRMDP